MHYKPLSIVDSASTTKAINAVSEGTEPSEGTKTDEKARKFPVRVAKGRHIPPISTGKVLVNSSAPGPTYVLTHWNLVKRRLSSVAQGLLHNVLGRPFHILVSNFYQRTINFPKHIMIAVATKPPDTVVQIELDTQIKQGPEEERDYRAREAIYVVNYKPKEERTV